MLAKFTEVAKNVISSPGEVGCDLAKMVIAEKSLDAVTSVAFMLKNERPEAQEFFWKSVLHDALGNSPYAEHDGLLSLYFLCRKGDDALACDALARPTEQAILWHVSSDLTIQERAKRAIHEGNVEELKETLFLPRGKYKIQLSPSVA